MERSRWNVSLSNIERMAQALEVPPWTLLVPPQQQGEKMDGQAGGRDLPCGRHEKDHEQALGRQGRNKA